MNNTEANSHSHPVTLNALFYVVYFIHFHTKLFLELNLSQIFLLFFSYSTFLISLQFVFLVRSCVTYTSIFRTEELDQKKVQLKKK